ncbi:MAG: spondin domain-containing protein [Marinibacterium sp.]
MSFTTHARGIAAAIAFGLPALAQAGTIEITFTNHQEQGGLYLTPLFGAFHDGRLDFFDASAAASAQLQALAENGDPSGVQAASNGFDTAVVTGPAGFPGAPVLDPGESASVRLNVDPATGQYFSFLSMVIPSNDLFIGNDDPFAYQVFDDTGAFTGPLDISIFGGDVWDAGTEANTNLDAAFNAAGGPRTAENGTVSLIGDLGYLVGQQTAAGTTISGVPGSETLFASIQVAAVPVPPSLPILASGLGLLGVFYRRRSRRAA